MHGIYALTLKKTELHQTLTEELEDLKEVIEEHQNPNIKSCALRVYNKINALAELAAKSSTTSSSTTREAISDLVVLNKFASNTRYLLKIENPSISAAMAYVQLANQSFDKIAEQEKTMGGYGISISTMLSILTLILQNVPSETNAKIKWGLIGVGTAGVIGLFIATTFFLKGEQSELKKLMLELAKAVLKIIDPHYSIEEKQFEAEEYLRQSFLTDRSVTESSLSPTPSSSLLLR